MVLMGTRREFFWNCTALAAAAALAPYRVLGGRVHLGGAEVHLDDISAEAFAAQVNTRFVIRDTGGAASLLLASVDPADASGSMGFPGPEARERFSLIFAGPLSQPLGQDTYRFDHAILGRFELFIVPIGLPVSGCSIYEAAFDRPTAGVRGRGRRLAQGRN